MYVLSGVTICLLYIVILHAHVSPMFRFHYLLAWKILPLQKSWKNHCQLSNMAAALQTNITFFLRQVDLRFFFGKTSVELSQIWANCKGGGERYWGIDQITAGTWKWPPKGKGETSTQTTNFLGSMLIAWGCIPGNTKQFFQNLLGWFFFRHPKISKLVVLVVAPVFCATSSSTAQIFQFAQVIRFIQVTVCTTWNSNHHFL